jgi:geranylgeranyl diphosphate synthase type II
MNIKPQLNQYISSIEAALVSYINESKAASSYGALQEVMAYSLLDAGKRIRPILCLEFCRICGGQIEAALPFACAVEMIHCYSLIHDDLPCMDNDELRRGKPSCHVKFGEALALLAGDALQTLAFETILNPEHIKSIPPEAALKAAYELAFASGEKGMAGGQVLDMQIEGKQVDIATLQLMDSGKTGAIIRAAALMGCIIGGARAAETAAAKEFAEHLGIAFQIVDDILDKTGNQELLGKPIGSDEDSNKSTYVTILGLDETKKQAEIHTNAAIKALEPFGEKADFLLGLSEYLLKRDN